MGDISCHTGEEKGSEQELIFSLSLYLPDQSFVVNGTYS